MSKINDLHENVRKVKLLKKKEKLSEFTGIYKIESYPTGKQVWRRRADGSFLRIH
jgi:hypothetical protein